MKKHQFSKFSKKLTFLFCIVLNVVVLVIGGCAIFFLSLATLLIDVNISCLSPNPGTRVLEG